MLTVDKMDCNECLCQTCNNTSCGECDCVDCGVVEYCDNFMAGKVEKEYDEKSGRVFIK
jgi:hypothetical protein